MPLNNFPSNSDSIEEGEINLYHTPARVNALIEAKIINNTTTGGAASVASAETVKGLAANVSKIGTSYKELAWETGGYGTTGELDDLPIRARTTAYFRVKIGDTLQGTDGYMAVIFKVDAIGNYISQPVTVYTESYTFTEDMNARIVVKNNNDPTVNINLSTVAQKVKLIRNRDTLLNQIDVISNNYQRNYGVEMALENAYYVDSDLIVAKVTLTAIGSKINIIRDGRVATVRSTVAFVNFTGNKIGFYNAVGDVASSTLTVFQEKVVKYTFVQGHEYVIESTRRDGFIHTIKITDAYTLDTDELTATITDADINGEGWGYRGYEVAYGTIAVNSFVNYSLQPYDCRCAIIGDSFIEGAHIFANKNSRYAKRIKDALHGNCFIDSMGGATTAQCLARFTGYVTTLCHPKYVIAACGANDYDYETWLTNIQSLITEITNVGAIPILVTVTRRLDTDNLTAMAQINTWIRTSVYKYIDINRITTSAYNGQTQNTQMFKSDKVHPLLETHELIYNKALLDVPELFN